MKKFLIGFLFFVLAQSAFSSVVETLKFSCTSPDLVYLNKVYAEGEIIGARTNNVLVRLNYYTRRAGRNSEETAVKEVELKGVLYKEYGPGELTKSGFLRLFVLPSKGEESDVVRGSFLIGYPRVLSSSIDLIDGYHYRGTCDFI